MPTESQLGQTLAEILLGQRSVTLEAQLQENERIQQQALARSDSSNSQSRKTQVNFR